MQCMSEIPTWKYKSVYPQTISEVQPTYMLDDRFLAHFSQPVQYVLNNIYHNKRIGTVGPVAWPPWSPDLNHLDF
jgi:hypothetical protein